MSVIFQCNVDDDLMEKFKIALGLNNATCDQVIEELMKEYISTSFSIISQVYRPTFQSKQLDENVESIYTAQAIRKIPLWAQRKNQITHKIIRAYFQLEAEFGHVTSREFEKLCSDKSHNDVFVPTFSNNYYQMKFDGPKSHGKVFEEFAGEVVLWDRIKDTLEKYKRFFCQ